MKLLVGFDFDVGDELPHLIFFLDIEIHCFTLEPNLFSRLVTFLSFYLFPVRRGGKQGSNRANKNEKRISEEDITFLLLLELIG